MKRNKKVVALIVSAITAMTSMMALSSQTKAAGNTVTVPTKIEYVENTYATYDESWGVTAPTKEGYLFGGWYKDAQGETVITEKGQVEQNAKVYAKFVPAQVLSVKAQNFSTTKEGDATTTTRLISSVDARAYSEVGFEIIDMERNHTIYNDKVNLVFEKLEVKESDKATEYTPQQVFGEIENAKGQRFMVLSLNGIPNAKWDSDIYVRPYWKTYDGLRIDGLAKYVYVNDGLHRWISIPVNLHTGAQVAGGLVSVQVPDGFKYEELRTGRVFSEMAAAVNGNVVKCVGNTTDGSDVAANGLYAVLRFSVTGDYKVGNGTFLNFTVNDLGFASNAENLVDMNIMNVQY